MQWPSRALIVGSVFLFFPVAHLRVFPALPIYVAEIPALAVIGLALLSWVRRLRQQPLMHRPDAVWSAGLFAFGGIITFLLRELPWRFAGLLKSFVLLPVAFFYALASMRLDVAEQKTILGAWWLGTGASALAGLLALASGYSTYDGRLAAHFSSPNHLAMLLAPGVVIGCVLSMLARQPGTRWIIGMGTMGIVAALVATRSYGVIAATLAGLLVVLLGQVGWRRMVRSWAMPVVLIIFALLLVPELSTEKFESLINFDERSSIASRLMIWQAGAAIARDSFPWGIGIGQFQAAYLAYQPLFPPYLEWAVPEPHQLFLAWYLSVGILGLAGVLWCLVVIVVNLWRAARAGHHPEALLAWCYLGLIGYWLVCGLVDTPYFKNDLAFGLWGILGLAWSLTRMSRENQV